MKYLSHYVIVPKHNGVNGSGWLVGV